MIYLHGNEVFQQYVSEFLSPMKRAICLSTYQVAGVTIVVRRVPLVDPAALKFF